MNQLKEEGGFSLIYGHIHDVINDNQIGSAQVLPLDFRFIDYYSVLSN